MNTLSIRQQLHSYLEVADDKKVKAFYTILEDDIKETVVEYTEALKNELDQAYASYQNGEAKMISAAESKRRINKLLKDRSAK